MNTTSRKVLAAAIVVGATCWLLPALSVLLVPADSGMIAMMALLYFVLPSAAIALGILATSCMRALFWMPAALGIAFPLLFPLAIEGSQDVAIYGVACCAIGYIAMLLQAIAIKCAEARRGKASDGTSPR